MNERTRGGLLAVLSALVVFFVVSWLLPEDEVVGRSNDVKRAPEASATRTDDLEHADVGRGVAVHELVSAPRDERSIVAAALQSEASPDETATPPSGTVLLGTVTTRGDGAPAKGRVDVVIDGAKLESVRLDARGRFVAGPFPASVGELLVRPTDGFATLERIDIDGREPQKRVDVVVDLEQKVRVRLVDRAGAPLWPRLGKELPPAYYFDLALVPVATIERPETSFDGVRGSLNNRFGVGSYWEEGGFGGPLEGDTIGTVTLHVRPPLWISLVVSHQVIESQFVTPETTEIVFAFEPSDLLALRASVRGVIVDAATKEPIVANIWLGSDPFPNGALDSASAANGEFHVEAAPPGERWLIVQANGYVGIARRTTVPRGGALDLGVIELHRPVSISGRVRESDGTPRSSTIRWGRVDPSTGKVDWTEQMSVRAQVDGTFTLPALEPAMWGVGVSPPNIQPNRPEPAYFAGPVVIVDARAGDVGNVEIVVQPAAVVTARLGKRLDDTVIVHATDFDGHPAGVAWFQPLERDGQLALLPGTYEFKVMLRDIELTRTTASVSGATQVVDIELP